MHQLGSVELQRSATPAGTGNAFNIQRTADDGPILWRVRVTPNRRNARQAVGGLLVCLRYVLAHGMTNRAMELRAENNQSFMGVAGSLTAWDVDLRLSLMFAQASIK
jgi:hypothetical protein